MPASRAISRDVQFAEPFWMKTLSAACLIFSSADWFIFAFRGAKLNTNIKHLFKTDVKKSKNLGYYVVKDQLNNGYC